MFKKLFYFLVLLTVTGISRAEKLDVKKGREIIQSSQVFRDQPLVDFPAEFAKWQQSFQSYISQTSQTCEALVGARPKDKAGDVAVLSETTTNPKIKQHTKCLKSIKQLNLAYVDQVFALKKWYVNARYKQLSASIEQSHKTQVDSITKSEI